MLKQNEVIKIIVPRYEELKVEQVWPLIKEIDDLMLYFPDYGDKQYPDRKFMYSILGTIRFEQLKTMVEGARTNRSITEEENDDNFVHIEANCTKKYQTYWPRKVSKISQSFL